MENWKVYAKITLAIIIVGGISLIIFAIFKLPNIGFDDILLAELAIFGLIIFIFWIWTKILRYIKQRKQN
ncbi:MAG: hypothetical protein ACFE8E_01245 [Candidatus Hodarchaeota archaeon]